MKKTVKIVLAVLAVLLIGLGVAWWRLDAIAAAAIERGGSYALKVPTTVDRVNLSLFGGSIAMEGLTIANPEGYDTPHLMQAGSIAATVQTGSLFSDTIVVPSIELDGLDVYIEEKDGQNNIEAILENLESADTSQEQAPSSRSYRIDRLVIRDVTAHVQLLPLGGDLSQDTIHIDEMVFENLTPDSAQGVVMAEVIKRVVPAILAQIAGKATQLPGDLADVVSKGVLPMLQSGGENLLKGAGESANKLREGLNQAGDGVKEGLKGLFGGDEQSQE